MLISKIQVRSSKISGQGTFAIEKISRGEFITKLTGVPITLKEFHKKYPEEAVSDDPLQIGENLYLILNHSSKAINHSCNPNTCLRNISDLYAIRDIRVGEEITYDYSTTVAAHDQWSMSCNCKAKNCRENIGNVSTIPHKTLSKYISLKAFQDFILDELERTFTQLPQQR